MQSGEAQVKITGAVGPYYNLDDIQFDAQRTVNLYLEYDELQTGADDEPWRAIGRPGKTQALSNSQGGLAGPLRGSWVTSDGLCYFVAGGVLYQLNGATAPFTYTVIGYLSTSNGPVDFADFNGLLCLVDGPYGYQYQNGVFAQITDPNFQGANTVVVFDGIFIFNTPNTNIFYYSGIDISAGLTFNGLDFDAKSGNSDPINGMLVFGRQLWVLGTQTGEIWVDNPGQTNQWQRLQGPYLQVGCAAFKTFKFSELGGTSGPLGFFLGQSPRGGPVVYKTDAYTVIRISTSPLEKYLAQYAQNLSQATALLYQINGHVFYQINIPDMPTSFVYDVTTSLLAGIPVWTEYAYYDSNNIQSRDLADNHCFYNGYHLVGSYNSPNILYLNPDDRTDVGSTIYIERTFPHIQNEMDRVFYNSFTAKVRTGLVRQTSYVYPTSPGGNTTCGSDPSNPQIIWTASTAGTSPLVGYNIYRSQVSDSADFILLDSVPTSTLTYTDTTAGPGTTNWYYIVAVDTLGNTSTPSPVHSCTTFQPNPWTLKYRNTVGGTGVSLDQIILAGTNGYAGETVTFSSSDSGSTWAADYSFPTTAYQIVANNTYLFGSDYGTLYSSLDGVVWTAVSLPNYSGGNGNILCAIDQRTGIIYVTQYKYGSGNVWLWRIQQGSNLATNILNGVGGPNYSTEYEQYSQIVSSTTQVVGWNYDGSLSTPYTSSDNGLTWVAGTTLGAGLDVQRCAYSGSIFLALGYNNNNGRVLTLTSPDGLTWTQQADVPSGPPYLDYLMAYNGYFITSDGSNIAYSLDGISWTTTTNPLSFVFGLYAASNRGYAYGSSIAETTNGTSFTQQLATPGGAVQDVFYSGSSSFACGNVGSTINIFKRSTP